MTWVIGAAPYFGGYGVMVSDVQVTLANGDTRDVFLQKAYPVGNYIVAGFAGSVFIGFRLLQTLRDFLALPSNLAESGGFGPAEVAQEWGPVAKQVFDNAPISERVLGSRLLIVGVHPSEDDFIPGHGRVYVCRLASPEFHPGISKRRLSVLSIGSGSNVVVYRRAIRQLLMPQNGLLQLETQRLGWAFGLKMGISMTLRENPRDGISQYLHINFASREGFQTETNNHREHLPDGTIRDFSMPPVATSWDMFCKMTSRMRGSPVAARC